MFTQLRFVILVMPHQNVDVNKRYNRTQLIKPP